MTILVFGHSGQVATELRRQADVIALSRSDADLSDPASCAAAIKRVSPNVVINAAAYTAVDKAEEEEALATLINGDAPGAMAEITAVQGIPFLHVSTDYVFDGSGDAPWRPTDSTGPLGAYGRSKQVGEAAIAAAGGQSAILRTSWVFSAHGNNFMKTMLRLGAERDALSIVADQVGGPTPASAIAAALLRMAEQMQTDPAKGGVHHFSGAPDVSWAAFATEIFDQAGLSVAVSPIATADYPTPAKRPGNSRLDCSELKNQFGIDQPDWRKGVAEVLAGLQ